MIRLEVLSTTWSLSPTCLRFIKTLAQAVKDSAIADLNRYLVDSTGGEPVGDLILVIEAHHLLPHEIGHIGGDGGMCRFQTGYQI